MLAGAVTRRQFISLYSPGFNYPGAPSHSYGSAERGRPPAPCPRPDGPGGLWVIGLWGATGGCRNLWGPPRVPPPAPVEAEPRSRRRSPTERGAARGRRGRPGGAPRAPRSFSSAVTGPPPSPPVPRSRPGPPPALGSPTGPSPLGAARSSRRGSPPAPERR